MKKLAKILNRQKNRLAAVAAIAVLLLGIGAAVSTADSWIIIGIGPIGGSTDPSISSISPTSGINTGTTDVTLSGANFTGTTSVKIGGTDVQSFSVVNDSTITAVIQAGLTPGTYHITVTNATGTSSTSSADEFTVTSPFSPVVSGVTPGSGLNHTTTSVTISGVNLDSATEVKIGTTSMSITSNTSTEIIAVVPAGLASGVYHITVTTPNGTSATGTADQFTVVDAPLPIITGVAPASGLNTAATAVVITGSNFATTNSVKIGAVSVSSYTVVDDSTINATIQPGLTPAVYDITVTNAYGISAVSSLDRFTVINGLTPAISGVSPNSGVNLTQTEVTISGTNLSGATSVQIGSTAMAIISNSSAEIKAVVPSGITAGIYHITVTNADGTSPTTAADQFTVIDGGPSNFVVIDDYEGVEVSSYNHYGTGCNSVFNTNSLYIKNGSQSRRILYSYSSDWGGLLKGNLVSSKDLSLSDAFAFWIKGDGTDNTVRLDVFEATNVSAYGPWSMTHEIYSSPVISMKNTAWQLVKIPFRAMTQNYDNGIPTDGNGIFDKNISAYQLVYTGKNTSTVPHYVDYLVATILNPPAAPSAFAGTATGTTEIKWTWSDNSTNETGFKVNDGAGVVKKTVSSNITEVTETSLLPNTPYSRNVLSYNTDGTSASTESVTRYTLANTPQNLRKTSATVTSIKFAWDAGQGGASKYSVYRAKDNKGIPGTWVKIKDSITNKEHEDSGLAPNTKYWYGVSAFNGDGIETSVIGKDAGNAVEMLTSADTTPPVISDVTVNDKTIFDRDIISSRPTIKATLTDNVSIDAASITVEAGSSYTPSSAPAVSFDTATGLMSITLTDAIPAGDLTLRISVKDAPAGNLTTFTRALKVGDGSLFIEGSVFNYPNPFNPLAETTKLGFNISKDATVTIYLFDITGKIVVKRDFTATAGYNEFTWNGRDDYGDITGNGVYMARIVGDGRLIGRAKVWVIKK